MSQPQSPFRKWSKGGSTRSPPKTSTMAENEEQNQMSRTEVMEETRDFESTPERYVKDLLDELCERNPGNWEGLWDIHEKHNDDHSLGYFGELRIRSYFNGKPLQVTTVERASRLEALEDIAFAIKNESDWIDLNVYIEAMCNELYGDPELGLHCSCDGNETTITDKTKIVISIGTEGDLPKYIDKEPRRRIEALRKCSAYFETAYRDSLLPKCSQMKIYAGLKNLKINTYETSVPVREGGDVTMYYAVLSNQADILLKNSRTYRFKFGALEGLKLKLEGNEEQAVEEWPRLPKDRLSSPAWNKFRTIFKRIAESPRCVTPGHV